MSHAHTRRPAGRQSGRWVLLCVLSMLALSCVSVPRQPTATDYGRLISSLQVKLQSSPADFETLRDLGLIHFQILQFERAEQYLREANNVDPQDPKTRFFLGLTLEHRGELNAALAIYIAYTDLSVLSPYRKLMEGRYRSITRDIIAEQFRSLLASERELGQQEISRSTVAVFPLELRGGDQKYSPLGKGLSEMIINDLGQVSSLRVVERVRVESLLEELRFARTDKVDPSTAPRLGRLLRAGQIVAGAFGVSTDEKIRIDVGLWDIVNRKFPETRGQSDLLDNLFALEKDLVFSIIRQMGISLTPVERERIQFVPTRNLLAFIAYSIGLEKEDGRDFESAKVYFNQAVTLDPNFSQAKTKADAADALSVAGGHRSRALLSAYKFEPPLAPVGPTVETPLLSIRFENLLNGLGAPFYPGPDSRKPVEEASATGVAVGKLPEAPLPPHR